MNDYFISLLKGLYPEYLLFLIIGITVRIRQRRWQPADWIVLLFMLAFILMTVLMPKIFYGKFTLSRRYLLIILPLGLAWAAEGLQWLYLKKIRPLRNRKLLIFLSVLILCFQLHQAISPIVRRSTSEKKSLEQEITDAAADFIRRDWTGPDRLKSAIFKCDYYQSGKIPVVDSRFERIGYLSGGQNFSPQLASLGMQPDYAVSDSALAPDGKMTLIHVLTVRNRKIYIWKDCTKQDTAD